MKIVQINTTCGVGSTGKIAEGISRLLSENSTENYILYSVKTDHYLLGIPCSNSKYVMIQAGLSHLMGDYGFHAGRAARKIVTELRRIQPDIVHLHNIHGHDCDLTKLFSYFKNNKIKLVWTFHDCWAFTAYCPHFTMVKCDKWKDGCRDCPQRKEYSLFFDRSSELYQRKKELFTGLDLTIVTPSQWLADLVKQSFLKDYPVKVINNGIDLSIFKPTPSDFRRKYAIPESRFILLGVTFDWSVRKGLDVFIELAKRLPQERYQIVLVGTNDKLDKQLPSNIISIHRTQNQQELAEIYSAADLFVNPTREENYPTVNMESIACGTPIITFRTGGSPEMIHNDTGIVVDYGNIDAMENEIARIAAGHCFDQAKIQERARSFDIQKRLKEYLPLYQIVVRQEEIVK